MIPWRKVKKQKLNLELRTFSFYFSMENIRKNCIYSNKNKKSAKEYSEGILVVILYPDQSVTVKWIFKLEKMYWQETLSAVPDGGFQAECYPAVRQLQSFGNNIYKLFILVRSGNQVWFVVKALGHVYTICFTATKVLIRVFRFKKVT